MDRRYAWVGLCTIFLVFFSGCINTEKPIVKESTQEKDNSLISPAFDRIREEIGINETVRQERTTEVVIDKDGWVQVDELNEKYNMSNLKDVELRTFETINEVFGNDSRYSRYKLGDLVPEGRHNYEFFFKSGRIDGPNDRIIKYKPKSARCVTEFIKSINKYTTTCKKEYTLTIKSLESNKDQNEPLRESDAYIAFGKDEDQTEWKVYHCRVYGLGEQWEELILGSG